MTRDKLVGRVFRNKNMQDLDFYVTNVRDTLVIGFWIRRSDKNLATRELEFIKLESVTPSDWKEVKST